MLPSLNLQDSTDQVTTGFANTDKGVGRSAFGVGLYSLRSRSRQVVSAFGNDPYRILPAVALPGDATGHLPSNSLPGAEGGFIADQEVNVLLALHGDDHEAGAGGCLASGRLVK